MDKIKDKRVVETFNLRNEEDDREFCEFRFIIENDAEFLKNKSSSWHVGKVKSMALRNHFKKIIKENSAMLETREFYQFQKEYNEKRAKRNE